MKTCACGGMLMDGWTSCRFCGRPVGAAGQGAPPPPPSFPPQGSPGQVPGAPPPPGGEKRSIPTWAVALGVVVVLGLLASFMFGGNDDDDTASGDLAAGDTSTSAPSTTLDPEGQLRSDIDSFCEGHRTGVPAALPYDRAPGRDPQPELGRHQSPGRALRHAVSWERLPRLG